MRRAVAFVIAMLSGWLVLCRAASAKPTRFLGSHPIPEQDGGSYCHIEAPHLHSYRPSPDFLFQECNHQYVFTGDPVPFGYQGERHLFYGHHPIPADGGRYIVYCFLDGLHYHGFAAPSEPDFVVKEGVAFYIGLFSSYFFRLEGQLRRSVNEFYRPYARDRPALAVDPPPEWRDDLRLPPARPQRVRATDGKELRRFRWDAASH